MSNKSGAASLSRCSRRLPPLAAFQLPCCVFTSVRFSPPSKKVSLLDTWKTNAHMGLVFRAKNTRGGVFPSAGRASSPRSQLWNSGSLTALAALRVSRVGRGSVCVGRTALCVRVNPRLRFSPLLSATTRMYHHVTVGCPQRDRTPSTPRFDPPSYNISLLIDASVRHTL